MTCEEAQEKFAWYWDLATNDPDRQAVDRHISGCVCCKEEFRLWEESRQLVRTLASEHQVRAVELEAMNRQVMERIYKEQPLAPPQRRPSRMRPGKLRRRAAVLACCMILIVAAFAQWWPSSEPTPPQAGIIQMPGVLDGSGATTVSAALYDHVPMASISDPILLQMTPSVSPYLIAMSVAALLLTLLAMNWLLRTRT